MEKKKELGKLETITILLLIIGIFIYEICFCNLKSIIQDGTYNFSLYRIIMYIIFGVLYKKFANKFISEAEKTLKSKKKIICIYIVFAIIFLVYKLFNEKNYYTLILIMLSLLNGLLFLLYITKDYIKNIIVTTLTLGFMFSISTEVYNVVDEKKHFMSTLNVAVGNFDLNNGLTNEDFNNIEFNYLSSNFAKDYFDKYTDFKMQEIPKDETEYSTPAGYFQLLYLPGSIGINIARLFGGSIADIFYAGRMANLITFSILLITIFKLLPVKKDTFYAIYLMPMSLVLASYYSVDGIIVGIIGTFIAYVFKLHKNQYDTINLKQFIIIISLYLLILMCKNGAYIAIGLILFILPVFKTLKENSKIRNITIIIVLATFAFGIFQVYNVSGMRDTRVEKNNPTQQIEYLLESPKNIMNVSFNTLRNTLFNCRFYEDFNKTDLFGKYATMTSFVLFIFVLYVAITDGSYRFKNKEKVLQYTSFVVTFFITVSVLYITYTDVGYPFTKGYQARYLTPVLPLLLVNISSKKVVEENNEEITYNNTAMVGGLITIVNLLLMVI